MGEDFPPICLDREVTIKCKVLPARELWHSGLRTRAILN